MPVVVRHRQHWLGNSTGQSAFLYGNDSLNYEVPTRQLLPVTSPAGHVDSRAIFLGFPQLTGYNQGLRAFATRQVNTNVLTVNYDNGEDRQTKEEKSDKVQDIGGALANGNVIRAIGLRCFEIGLDATR